MVRRGLGDNYEHSMKLQKEPKEEGELDFDRATRRALFGRDIGGAVPGSGKSAAERPTRHLRVKVTMNLDGDVLAHVKQRALEEGRSYQVLINDALREVMEGTKPERLAKVVGSILARDASFIELLHSSMSGQNSADNQGQSGLVPIKEFTES